ncbi:histidine kinase dimerization/phospho-acceptor domain-containing protein [Luteimonas rhizosphaerae]
MADFIRQHAPDIMDGAEAFARTQSPAGVELSAKALRNHIPEILKAIVLDLSEDQSAQQQLAKAEGRAPVSTSGETAASIHGRMRAADGFDVNQMIAEYRALRASVLRLWIAEAPLTTDSVEDVIRFNEAIDQAIAESLARFNTEVESWRQVFLGALGHDLRGPLTAIVYSADRLSDTVQGTPHAKYVDRIVSGGARIHDLLDDLLVYTKSKLGAGMVISRDTCDLADALHEEVDLIRAALPDVPRCFHPRSAAQPADQRGEIRRRGRGRVGDGEGRCGPRGRDRLQHGRTAAGRCAARHVRSAASRVQHGGRRRTHEPGAGPLHRPRDRQRARRRSHGELVERQDRIHVLAAAPRLSAHAGNGRARRRAGRSIAGNTAWQRAPA